MNYVLNTPGAVASLRGIATGTTSVAAIYTRDLAQIRLPLPALEEQEPIAAALTDADALIESLEQLLAKKRQIKQGAMQELLTGQRRLPGFERAWRAVQLAPLGSTYGGLVGKTKADFGVGSARYVTFMNVMANVVIKDDCFESVDVGPNENQAAVRAGDLLFNGSSETPEEVGFCSLVKSEVDQLYLNSFCFGFRPRVDAEMDGLYLAYYFRSGAGRDLLKSLAQGATRYNLSKRALLGLTFALPELGEQQAISDLLAGMDAELDAVETKLTKARHLKQAMMQALLTGRIRLV